VTPVGGQNLTSSSRALQDLRKVVGEPITSRINSRTHIRVKKTTISLTKWDQGTIPKRHFPLFKDKKPLGPGWSWRAARLTDGSGDYRLLVQLRQDKPNFKAWLVADISGQWAMMGRLESHGHAGLHCHIQCPANGIEVGLIDPPGAISVPHWKAHHRRPNVVMSQSVAWELALRFFRAQSGAMGNLL
jgi:hypothetical protein